MPIGDWFTYSDQPPLANDEVILKQDYCHVHHGWLGGGWLFVTLSNRRFLLTKAAHNFPFGPGLKVLISIPLGDIVDVYVKPAGKWGWRRVLVDGRERIEVVTAMRSWGLTMDDDDHEGWHAAISSARLAVESVAGH